MKNPFPGMNPYLERYWGDTHTRLATYICDALQRQLPDDLVACVEEHLTVGVGLNEEGLLRYYPDVRVEEVGPPSNSGSEPAPVAVNADTIEVAFQAEPMTQRSIRIVERRGEDRIVTAIELLSPANKIGSAGRKAYRRKRKDLLKAQVSLVEIDLVRAGRRNFVVPANRIPRRFQTTYSICVSRSWKRGIAQLYRVPLRQALPKVSIPLRKKDKEVSLDLQSLIDTVYENGRYFTRGYKSDLVPPLSSDDAAWADQLLREKGLK